MSSSDEQTEGALHSKKIVPFKDGEILMLLRAYQLYPCAWTKIIQNIKENDHLLNETTRALYGNSTNKQLKDRLCTKLGKLLRKPADDEDNDVIRSELAKVKRMQKETKETTIHKKKTDTKMTAQRRTVMRNMSSDDDVTQAAAGSSQDDQPGPSRSIQSKKGKEKKPKKRSIMELMRENHEQYNKFITKKVPKLLKALGVESSDSDSE